MGIRRGRGPRALVAGSLLVGTVLVGSVVVGSLPASANTPVSLYVSTMGSDGGGSNTCTASSTPCLTIRQAINEAESNYTTVDDVTINVAGGTYTENETISASSLDSLTIAGAGASTTNVNGDAAGTVFIINDGTVTVSGLTIENGQASAVSANGIAGGGIYNNGTLALTGVTIANNTGLGGGGIVDDYDGILAITNSTVSQNTATTPLCTSSCSTFSGGILEFDNIDSAQVTITNSTVSQNTATTPLCTSSCSSGAGGIGYDGPSDADLTITNSTVSQNTATTPLCTSSCSSFGGGIVGPAFITSSTVAQNKAAAPSCMSDCSAVGAGIWGFDSNGYIAASIVANNGSGGDCGEGTPNDGGYNLVEDATCGFTSANNDVLANPDLGALNHNGGPTETMLPAPTSPAIGVIPSGTTLNGVQVCPRTDQRGVASAPGANCTIGAVEVLVTSGPLQITTTALPGGIVGQPYSFTLQATGGNPPYTWWYAKGGDLPRGVHFSTAGVLSGTPKKAGNYSITFRVRDTQIAGHHVNKAHAALTVTIT